jgi:hypothetical protein
MHLEEMSAYDRSAWDTSMKAAYDPPTRRLVPGRVRELTGKASEVAAAGYEKLPEAVREQADWVMEKAFDGALSVTFEPALRSVNRDALVRRASSSTASVRELSDLRTLSLRECDQLRRSGLPLTLASAAEGAASSIAVTGAEVSTTVSGGTTAAVAFGAIAADVAATLAAMGRSIAVVAATYGYDVREPDEELFALGVLSFASASSLGGKTAAMASLSRLTQQMMRQATWKQLQKNVLVNAIEHSYKALGFKLTKKKLAQAVPIVGAVVNAGVNAGLVVQTKKRAEAVYRLRFLSEKYGIDPSEWRRDQGATGEAVEEVVLVDEQLEQAVTHPGSKQVIE